MNSDLKPFRENNDQVCFLFVVCFLLVSEVGKWFGGLFEMILETFYGEEKACFGKGFLKFESTHLNKISVLIFCCVYLIFSIVIWSIVGSDTKHQSCLNEAAVTNISLLKENLTIKILIIFALVSPI